MAKTPHLEFKTVWTQAASQQTEKFPKPGRSTPDSNGTLNPNYLMRF